MQAGNIVGFLSRDLLRNEVGRIRSPGEQTIEVLFVKFEGVANILGFITDASGVSGKVRIVVGTVQVVVFTGMGMFYWIQAWWRGQEDAYSDYARSIVYHGFGNVTRGAVECFPPMGNWIVIAYTLVGERMRYACEENLPRDNLLAAVVPSANLEENYGET